MDTIDYDLSGGQYAGSSGSYIVPQAGAYLVVASLSTNISATAYDVQVAVGHNGGSALSGITSTTQRASGTIWPCVVATDIVKCDAGDTLGSFANTPTPSVTVTTTPQNNSLTIMRVA
jgi:hypothetical protein